MTDGEREANKPGDDVDRFNPATDLPGLTRAEKDTISEHSRPNAALVHETIRADGQSELERGWSSLLTSAFAAGLSISFSVVVEGCLQARLPDAPWRELVVGLGYSVGFLIVVLGRQQLFTENTLTPILELLYCRNLRTLGRVVRLWALILVGNMLATCAVAFMLAHAPGLESDIKSAMAEVSRAVYAHDWASTFTGAIFAGWLIALMVWLLPASGDSAPLIIVILTYVIAIGGFQHSIAGSVEGFYIVALGEKSLGDFLNVFFIPTVLGNVVGGVALVAVLNYGQVAAELKGE
ncbi:MAG: formate/nitrite transporter family protein [Caulobacteraceae bacterium]|nr:formate/nitrite transporter family protein [Caulobacter sp.]